LDVDKTDLRRLDDFTSQKVYELLLIGRAVAKANNRDIVEPWNLPLTKRLQERMDEFKVVEFNLNRISG
jgi:hypothetical protein